MAARDDAVGERFLHGGKVVVHDFTTCLLEFQEDMIVGDRREDAGFLQTEMLDDFEILRVGANPARDFGILMAEGHAAFDGFAVLFTINEKFALADDAVGAAEPVHHIVQIDNVFGRVWRAGLLAIAECCIRNPDFTGRTRRDVFVFKQDTRHVRIRELFTHEIRMFDFLQLIAVLFLYKGREF